jgi:hypothetical protein
MTDEKALEMRRVFGSIHANRAWGDSESVSGPGSTRERAAAFLPDLIGLVRSLQLRSLVDAPCGDFNWAAPLADAVPRYIGVDVVPELIAANQRYASDRRQFLCLDMTTELLPPADAILCRDGLVHLCIDDIFATLANFRRSGARFLLTTTFIGDRGNVDIETGGWRPLNLEREPFSFPPPAASIDERCHHTGGVYSDKRLALWRIEDLPLDR